MEPALLAPAEKFSARTHLPVLDGVRAIAILLVICVHFCQSFPSESNQSLWKVAMWGQTGVDLFFVLSGFLITGILLDSKASPHFLRNFYIRRTLRIFPLYYLTLVAVYVVWPALHLSASVAFAQSSWYWFYLQDIPLAFAPSLQKGPEYLWSLAVEEHFYLVWPFLVLRFDGSRLLRIISGAIVVSLVLRVVLGHYEMYYFTLARMDSLAIGSALAIFVRASNSKNLSFLVPWAKRIFAFVGFALLVQLLLPRFQIPVVHVVRNTLIAIVYACGIVLALEYQRGPIGKILGGRLLGSVGRYSYAMYVFHPFILTWMHNRGMSFRPLPFLVSILLTYGAGFTSWRLLEKPIMKFKRFFDNPPSQSQTTMPPELSKVAAA